MDLSIYVEYVKNKGEITLPDLQTYFSLSYGKARGIIDELERRNVIRFKEALTYVYCGENANLSEQDIRSVPVPLDLEIPFSRYVFLYDVRRAVESAEPLYQSVAEYCALVQRASISEIQRKFKMGYAKAGLIMDFLIEHGIVSAGKKRKLNVSAVEYAFALSDAFLKHGED